MNHETVTQTKNVTDGTHIDKVAEKKDETPAEIAPKMHAPYPKKPEVQVLHETLTDKTPTGYAPHTEEK